MISYLIGKIIDKSDTEITLLTGGVGYQLLCPTRVIASLSLNSLSQFFIYAHIREDAFTLFGFKDKPDKLLFTMLISVSGIGPKTGLAILSAATTDEIETAIRSADVEFFAAIPGIGKKSAQRIIVDLKAKLGAVKDLDLSEADGKQISDAQEALKSLGFSSPEAKDALAKIKDKSTLSQSELVKLALKNLGK